MDTRVQPRLYTTGDMKTLLGRCSDSTLNRMLKRGEIPRPWKRRLWLAVEVDAFFDELAQQKINSVQNRSNPVSGSNADCNRPTRL